MFAEFIEIGRFDSRCAYGCRNGAVLPCLNYIDECCNAKSEGQGGKDPGGAIEAGRGGSGKHRRAIFLHEGLFDETVAVTPLYGSHEFVAHAVRIGASDMVAFQQEFAAGPANAHEPVSDFLETGGGISGAGEGDYSYGEERAVKNAAEERV